MVFLHVSAAQGSMALALTKALYLGSNNIAKIEGSVLKQKREDVD